ncbi:Protein N-acetyltransferase, RimJ/RimL family [Streptomyces sp. TverLS-915]|uniref:GNAT family N-acetyltransferase n=1 Tax=Streptomyces sp. TverLS-915 TaxID=1839763 RepID=UPI00081E7FA5|nr:GNAT family N-acetyltransferase [Streptomyces sp. TverLS-915]SCD81912.1 Protein N-acetyltransferase, RimJ/RimL family [Streptomyces sp. TverLS-915]
MMPLPPLAVPATVTAPALRLRPWSAADLTELADVFPLPGAPEEWLAAETRGRAAGERQGFAMRAETAGAAPRLVGHLVLKTPAAGPREVGYWTAEAARGTGVATRALRALTTHVRDQTDLRELRLLHQEDNTASCRVAEKSGYVFSRVLPAFPPAFPRDGHLHVRHLTG